ncbi:MAG TPA: DUF4350 domain-containing protein [Nitrososphaerales archaeon]|nr:DUF4350 domain-containing protein [Nitrososphaerales archaeon]
MRPRNGVIVGVVAGLIFASLLVYFTSSLTLLETPDDFSPTNTAWNGMAAFDSIDKPILMHDLTLLPVNGKDFVLMEIGPSTPFTNPEAGAVSLFVRSGGTLVVADDFGSGNTLLQGMNLTSRFTGSLLADPLFNFQNSWLVVSPTVEMANITSLAFNYASTLSVTDSGAQALGYSSDFSYIYPTQPRESLSNATHGPFPVLAKAAFGQGSVVLVSDASVFINSMIGRNGNRALLKDLSVGTVLFDTSHLTVGPTSTVRNFEFAAYSLFSAPEVRYSAALLGLAIIAAYRVGKVAPDEEDELKQIVREHPEWDETKLRELREEMEANE